MKHTDFSLFFKINLAITILLFLLFLPFNQEYTIMSFIATTFGAISSATILYILLYLVLFLFIFTDKFILYLSALVFIIVDLALIVDFLIYRLFKFHINSMVLNILTSPDSLDSIQIGITAPIFILAFIIALIFLEIFIIKKVSKKEIFFKKNLNSNINKIVIPLLCCIILSEKFTYGILSLKNDSKIISNFSVIPLYQPLTFNKFASKYFNYKPKQDIKTTIDKYAKLHYPLNPIKLKKNIKKFDIYLIVSDSVRASIIDKKTAPILTQFKENSINLPHHYSGGNSTRFGIFSLFYALHPTYWFNFLHAKKSPVFFDILKELNYDINIISATNTNWPEFKKTCYVSVQKSIKDDFQAQKPYQKDKLSCEYLVKKIEEKGDKPTFNFIFFDSPHGYSYPENENIFKADSSHINYLTISKDSDALQSAFRAYKNAVAYNDKLFGNIIKKLKEKNLYNQALIIFTADHGQEFFEPDNFGHNTAFNDMQIHVPFFIKLPDNLKVELPKEYPNSFTSHLDVVPTILTLLGVKTPPSYYSNGSNIFDKNYKKEYLFCANWNNSAIITKKLTYIFSNLPNKIFKNEIRDTISYTKIKNLKPPSKLLLDVLDKNKKFLK